MPDLATRLRIARYRAEAAELRLVIAHATKARAPLGTDMRAQIQARRRLRLAPCERATRRHGLALRRSRSPRALTWRQELEAEHSAARRAAAAASRERSRAAKAARCYAQARARTLRAALARPLVHAGHGRHARRCTTWLPLPTPRWSARRGQSAASAHTAERTRARARARGCAPAPSCRADARRRVRAATLPRFSSGSRAWRTLQGRRGCASLRWITGTTRATWSMPPALARSGGAHLV